MFTLESESVRPLVGLGWTGDCDGRADDDGEGDARPNRMFWPLHLALGRLTDATDGYEAGKLVLVRGDQIDHSGTLSVIVDGNEMELPSKIIIPVAAETIHARALYDFTAAEDNELSLAAGDALVLLPAASDPTGWCMVSHQVTHARGLVPERFVAPLGIGLSTFGSRTPIARSSAKSGDGAKTAEMPVSPATAHARQWTPPTQPDGPGAAGKRTALFGPLSCGMAADASMVRLLAAMTQDDDVNDGSGGVGGGGVVCVGGVGGGVGGVGGVGGAPLSPPPSSPPPPASSPPALPSRRGSGESGGRSNFGYSQGSPPRTPSHADARRRAALATAAWETSQQGPEQEAAGYVAYSLRSAARATELSRLRHELAGTPRPAANFVPAHAMDAIFALGTRVAVSSCSDPAHAANARGWRTQIGELQRDLASWARWDEHLPRLENSAALALQSFARRRSEYRRFQVAVREARMRRHMAEQMAERAAMSIQNSTRKVQAMQLVAQRRGAIRIQRHWRGHLGRRKAAVARRQHKPPLLRLRLSGSTASKANESAAAAAAAAAPAAAAAAAAALVEAGKADAGGMGSTAGTTATAPPPRQSLSFGGRLAKSLSFGRRSKADATSVSYTHLTLPTIYSV